MQTANRTEPCGSVKSHLNSSEPSAVFCSFGLDWFGFTLKWRMQAITPFSFIEFSFLSDMDTFRGENS
ncbi:hypothetical protein MTR_4g080940 [Medicago truncatula]|uniref:Uncharacterized protein n=1 Tax=Medicago truncatula TaxID=3880 RepID=G7JDW3_MEDTR|nr:hypothetical protein MTR_4g080940 [Medicago truncatula]